MERWDAVFAAAIDDFRARMGRYPNVVLACEDLYESIDGIAWQRANQVTDERGRHPDSDDGFSVSEFTHGDCLVEFAMDERVPVPEFVMVWDQEA